jgi:hypothetical protein
VRLRSAPVDPATLPEDLGVDWSRWSDGKAYRLKRKKDFPHVDPGLARTACEAAAIRMGKVARTVRDKMVPAKLIWVQFADAAVRDGQPCPRCGGRRILRLHGGFGRCAQCKAQLLLSDEAADEAALLDESEDSPEEGAAEDEAAAMSAKMREKSVKRLEGVTNLHLKRAKEGETTESYTGWGERESALAVVALELRRVEGEPLTAENLYERLEWAGVYPAARLAELVDVDGLVSRREADWDLVLDESA